MNYNNTDYLSKVLMDVIYVNKDILNILVSEYVDNYVNKYEMRDSQLLFNASNDKNFTEKVAYKIIKNLLSTYEEDMKKLKELNVSSSVILSYRRSFKDKVMQIYPYLKGRI